MMLQLDGVSRIITKTDTRTDKDINVSIWWNGKIVAVRSPTTLIQRIILFLKTFKWYNLDSQICMENLEICVEAFKKGVGIQIEGNKGEKPRAPNNLAEFTEEYTSVTTRRRSTTPTPPGDGIANQSCIHIIKNLMNKARATLNEGRLSEQEKKAHASQIASSFKFFQDENAIYNAKATKYQKALQEMNDIRKMVDSAEHTKDYTVTFQPPVVPREPKDVLTGHTLLSGYLSSIGMHELINT
ncbi:MAG: hypothetical protein P4L16_00915 [Chlamydiales bacterium]|nr:hypothetical protein [Chlamydiales bacterium]